jgi:hypothetical protein
MMDDNTAYEDCKAHGRLDQRVKHIEEDNKIQWVEINNMKKWLIGTLTSSILSLMGVIIILLISILTRKVP